MNVQQKLPLKETETLGCRPWTHHVHVFCWQRFVQTVTVWTRRCIGAERRQHQQHHHRLHNTHPALRRKSNTPTALLSLCPRVYMALSVCLLSTLTEPSTRARVYLGSVTPPPTNTDHTSDRLNHFLYFQFQVGIFVMKVVFSFRRPSERSRLPYRTLQRERQRSQSCLTSHCCFHQLKAEAPCLGSWWKSGSPEKPRQLACCLKCSRSESFRVVSLPGNKHKPTKCGTVCNHLDIMWVMLSVCLGAAYPSDKENER